MSVRHRDVSPDEVDDARKALQAAKKKGDYEAQNQAMEVLAILRAAHREQYVELGMRHDTAGVRIDEKDSTFVASGPNTFTFTKEG